MAQGVVVVLAVFVTAKSRSVGGRVSRSEGWTKVGDDL